MFDNALTAGGVYAFTTRLTPRVYFTVGFFIVWKKTQAYEVQQNQILLGFIVYELGL